MRRRTKTIIVASKNPVKLRATLDGFQRMFPQQKFTLQSVTIPSGVKDQPRSDKETLRGAENRASAAARKYKEADFWVGIEGGIERMGNRTFTFAWIVVIGKKGKGLGKTAAFELPPQVIAQIGQGKELGMAMDAVFTRTNSKQKEGAIGILTDNIIDRKTLYTQAVINALIPFLKRDLYK